jgi:hypothetical protein
MQRRLSQMHAMTQSRNSVRAYIIHGHDAFKSGLKESEAKDVSN